MRTRLLAFIAIGMASCARAATVVEVPRPRLRYADVVYSTYARIPIETLWFGTCEGKNRKGDLEHVPCHSVTSVSSIECDDCEVERTSPEEFRVTPHTAGNLVVRARFEPVDGKPARQLEQTIRVEKPRAVGIQCIAMPGEGDYLRLYVTLHGSGGRALDAAIPKVSAAGTACGLDKTDRGVHFRCPLATTFEVSTPDFTATAPCDNT